MSDLARDAAENTVACVIGFPAAHSRSPLIHNYWLKKHGITGSYGAEAVPPADLEKFFAGLRSSALRGCNVTVPHKEEALKLVDAADDLARKAGAVNTVIVKNGRLEGRNTDVHGFAASMAGAREWKKKKPALVVGAGGAARAVLAALDAAGCKEIRLVNRTSDRARALAKELQPRLARPIAVAAWQDREDALEDIGLLVNTTTQGMEGQEPLDLDLRRLPEGAVVSDLVYTPLLTPLLAEAKRRGHAAIDGLGMLLHQAAPAFQAWFGVRPEVTLELRALVERSLKEKA